MVRHLNVCMAYALHSHQIKMAAELILWMAAICVFSGVHRFLLGRKQ